LDLGRKEKEKKDSIRETGTEGAGGSQGGKDLIHLLMAPIGLGSTREKSTI